MPTNLDLRFAVGGLTIPHSGVWRAFSNRNEVYVAIREMAHVEKISFHSSGICRRAFTQQHGRPSTIADRATIKWKRVPTPPKGMGQAIPVMRMAFPTDYLSAIFPIPAKPIQWLVPGPSPGARFVDMLYTNESLETVTELFAVLGQQEVLSYTKLPNSEAFVISTHTGPWENNDLSMPASKKAGQGSAFSARNLIFSAKDPRRTGRPIRISTTSHPKDGEVMYVTELGGYDADPRHPAQGNVDSSATITRQVELSATSRSTRVDG